MKKTLLILLLINISNVVFSQQIKFEGIVVEKKKEPISNATVTIEKTSFIQQTDEKGKFLFKEDIPSGKYIVSVSKIGFVTKFFVVSVEQGKDIIVNKVVMKLTKNEKRRRWVNRKVREEEERRIKRERKKIGAILKEDTPKKEPKKTEKPVVKKEVVKVKVVKKEEPKIISKETLLKEKYAKKLDVLAISIVNIPLYKFVDQWEGVPYLFKGVTKKGVDVPLFVREMYREVYGKQLENTIQKQFESESIDRFTNKDELKEGDLIFFHGMGKRKGEVVYVGVYLSNHKFVCVSRVKQNGKAGVKISDLREEYWTVRYICGARAEK